MDRFIQHLNDEWFNGSVIPGGIQVSLGWGSVVLLSVLLIVHIRWLVRLMVTKSHYKQLLDEYDRRTGSADAE
jgi:hypothetical protein